MADQCTAARWTTICNLLACETPGQQGIRLDGGTVDPHDGGFGGDSGVPIDAGTQPDASVGPDGGGGRGGGDVESDGSESSCGCRTAGAQASGAALIALIASAAAGLARRSSRARSKPNRRS